MVNVIVQLSKYLITLLMVLFTVQSFLALRERDEEERSYILEKQILMILLMNFICFFVMYLQEREFYIIKMFLCTLGYLLGVQVVYRLLFKKASMILLNNMCMLLCIGLIMLTRLNAARAETQFKIIVISTLLSFIVPVIIRKVKILKDLTWLYGIAGLHLRRIEEHPCRPVDGKEAGIAIDDCQSLRHIAGDDGEFPALALSSLHLVPDQGLLLRNPEEKRRQLIIGRAVLRIGKVDAVDRIRDGLSRARGCNGQEHEQDKEQERHRQEHAHHEREHALP